MIPIIKQPVITDIEVNKAMMRELTTGIELKKQWENRREIEAAQQAKEKKGHKTIAGLGKCVAVIPEWEFFRMQQKYGSQEVGSKEFIRYFQKKYPHLSPNKV
jgi:hypothetical protein